MRWLLALLLVAGCTSSHGPKPFTGITAKIKVGGNPCGIASTPVGVFVSDAADGRLLLIDPATHTATRVATLDATPCEMTFAFGYLWVTTQSGVLDRVDVHSRAITRIAVGAMSYEAEPALGAIWVSDRSSAQLTRVDVTTLKTSVLPLPGTHPGGLVFAFGSLWVGDDTAGASQLLRVDPVRRTVARVRAGHRPAYVTATGSNVWVSDVEDGTVSVIDPTTLAHHEIPAGISPVNLDVQREQVWVPDDQGNAVYELSGGASHRYPTPGGPAVVAPVGPGVWVSLYESGQVWELAPYVTRR